MAKAYQSDYEIGYNYARDRYAAGMGSCRPEQFFELARAFLLEQGSAAEVSRGMGSYYLRISVKLLLAELGYK